jgi:peptidoglycan/LPS O-acetylase OafA/YrhL
LTAPICPPRLACSAASIAGSAFRRDLQGLRGVAVLLVVLYHVGVPFLPGGYVGVDVFFVISGYLITGLLVREVGESGRIDYVRFVARRARRLLPAALVVIAVVAGTSVIIYPPLEREGIVSAARAAAVYVSNLWFAGRAVDYLGGDAATNPMTHMWSLAVEEQFYLLWPWLVALAAAGRSKAEAVRRTLRVVVAATAVSLGACIWMTWQEQPWAFFGTPFRSWEFGLGAIVVLAGRYLQALPARMTRAMGFIGAMAVILSAVVLTDSTLFPGGWAMLPAGGTALVLAGLTSNEPSRLKALLSTSVLSRAGDISYSWYLWHWPLLVMAPVLLPGGGVPVTIAAIVLSVLLAELSYRFVEEPLRHHVVIRLPASRVVGVALAGTIAAAVALTLMKRQAAEEQLSEKYQLFKAAQNDLPVVYAKGCHVGITETNVGECTAGALDSLQVVVLFGDSHAAHWYPALEQLAIKRGWKLLSITKSACPAVDASVLLESHRRPYHECAAWRAAALRRIAEVRPVLVVLGSSSRYTSVSASDWEAATLRMIDAMAAVGATTVIMRDTPWPGFSAPTCLARAEHRNKPPDDACVFNRDLALAPGAAIYDAERRAIAATRHRAQVVDLTEQLCPTDSCAVIAADVVRFSDDHHLTATFSKALSEPLNAALTATSWRLRD